MSARLVDERVLVSFLPAERHSQYVALSFGRRRSHFLESGVIRSGVSCLASVLARYPGAIVAIDAEGTSRLSGFLGGVLLGLSVAKGSRVVYLEGKRAFELLCAKRPYSETFAQGLASRIEGLPSSITTGERNATALALAAWKQVQHELEASAA